MGPDERLAAHSRPSPTITGTPKKGPTLMAEHHLRPNDTGLGQALGRIASGLYILTVRSGGVATGMRASWGQQAGFDPPMLTVAVRRDRPVGDWMAASGAFTLSQLAVGSKALIRHFGR